MNVDGTENGGTSDGRPLPPYPPPSPPYPPPPYPPPSHQPSSKKPSPGAGVGFFDDGIAPKEYKKLYDKNSSYNTNKGPNAPYGISDNFDINDLVLFEEDSSAPGNITIDMSRDEFEYQTTHNNKLHFNTIDNGSIDFVYGLAYTSDMLNLIDTSSNDEHDELSAPSKDSSYIQESTLDSDTARLYSQLKKFDDEINKDRERPQLSAPVYPPKTLTSHSYLQPKRKTLFDIQAHRIDVPFKKTANKKVEVADDSTMLRKNNKSRTHDFQKQVSIGLNVFMYLVILSTIFCVFMILWYYMACNLMMVGLPYWTMNWDNIL